MVFYDILCNVDIDSATSKFLLLCKDTPDEEETKQSFLKVYEGLKAMKPIISEGTTLIISEEKDIDGQMYYEVSSTIEGDPYRYGLEMVPRKEIIGYKVDEENVKHFGTETFVAAVLWEMTWFGFEEDSMLQETMGWEFEDEDDDHEHRH